MKKENKIIILVFATVAFLSLSIYLLTRAPSNENEKINPNNIAQESENIDLDSFLQIDESDIIPPPIEIDVPADLDWREAVKAPTFKVEFMSDEEKELIGIPKESRTQVLSRDEDSGLILAYKIIENDADIVTGPQN